MPGRIDPEYVPSMDELLERWSRNLQLGRRGSPDLGEAHRMDVDRCLEAESNPVEPVLKQQDEVVKRTCPAGGEDGSSTLANVGPNIDPDLRALEVRMPAAKRPNMSALRVVNVFGEIEVTGHNEFKYVAGPVNEDELRAMLAARISSPDHHPRNRTCTPDSMVNDAESSGGGGGSSVAASSIFNYRCETPGYYVRGMDEWSAPARLPGYFSRPPLRLTHERRFCRGLPPKRAVAEDEDTPDTILEDIDSE